MAFLCIHGQRGDLGHPVATASCLLRPSQALCVWGKGTEQRATLLKSISDALEEQEARGEPEVARKDRSHMGGDETEDQGAEEDRGLM